jgi:hypothetical protein
MQGVFMEEMMTTKLLDQVKEIARLKHLSISTEEAYLQWIHPVR